MKYNKKNKERIQAYIKYGWHKTLLVDLEGKVSEQRRHEVQRKFEKLAQSLLDSEGITRTAGRPLYMMSLR